MIKRLVLLGFLLTLIIGIPLALFVLQNQTQPTTKAAAVTKFSFDGPTSVNLNQTFDEKLAVDPGGGNQVSFVKFTFTFDNTKLDKVGTQPVAIDSTYTVLEQPQVNCTNNICTVTATISVGQNQNAIIKTKTDIATIHFVSKANTDPGSPTQLTFANGQNQALSVGTSDQPAENVFQEGLPFSITIGQQQAVVPSTVVTPTPTTSVVGPGNTGNPSTTGSSGGSGTSGAGNLTVTCTSFTPSVASGNVPLNVTFTTVGQSTTDSIARIDLTYGDGTSDSVASGSGVGTGNINNQISHNYTRSGSFTAQAILTTAGGAVSNPSTCRTIINAGVSPTPIGKLPPTGPGETLIFAGIGGTVLTIVGTLLMLAL